MGYLNGTRITAEGLNGTPPAFDQVSNAGDDYTPITTNISRHRGRLLENFADRRLESGPNLGLVGRVHEQFLKAREQEEDVNYYSTIDRAHLNFLKDAIYLLYTHNRNEETARCLEELQTRFPNDTEGTRGLDEFAVRRTEVQIERAHSTEVRAIIEGLLFNHYYNLALGEEDRALGLLKLTEKTWTLYHQRIRGQVERTGLLPLNELQRLVRDRELGETSSLSEAMRRQLRTRLGMGNPSAGDRSGNE